jgi:uncharacterized protein
LVERSLRLAFIRDDAEATRLPDLYDPWVVIDDAVDPLELIEDELLLALPVVPRHAPEDCVETLAVGAPAAEAGAEAVGGRGGAGGSDRPFAVLAELKSSRRGD